MGSPSDPDRPRVGVGSVEVFVAIDGGLMDLLRSFRADVYDLAAGKTIGEVLGWIGWCIQHEDLAAAGDLYDDDALNLGRAAEQIIDEHPSRFIDTVLFIQNMQLEEQCRGFRIAGEVIAELMDVFRLDAAGTVVALIPEPMNPAGTYAGWPGRDAAFAKLTAAYAALGLRRWSDGPVWWQPFGEEQSTSMDEVARRAPEGQKPGLGHRSGADE